MEGDAETRMDAARRVRRLAQRKMDLFLLLETQVTEMGVIEVVQSLADVAAATGGSDMRDWVPDVERDRWIGTEYAMTELVEHLQDLWGVSPR